MSDRLKIWMGIPENVEKLKVKKRDSSKMGKYDKSGEKIHFIIKGIQMRQEKKWANVIQE